MANDFTLYATEKGAKNAWNKFLKLAPEGFAVDSVQYKKKKGKVYVIASVDESMETVAFAEFIMDMKERFEVVRPGEAPGKPKPDATVKKKWTPPVMSPKGFRPGSKRAIAFDLLDKGTTVAEAEAALGWAKSVVLSAFHETKLMVGRKMVDGLVNSNGEKIYKLA